MQNYALKFFGGGKMGQKCPLFSSTSLSDPPNMPKWCKNYQNMHKSAKLCIQMQKYAHKCKNMHTNAKMQIREEVTLVKM